MIITTAPNLSVLPAKRAPAMSAHVMEAGHFVSVTHDLKGEFVAIVPAKATARDAILSAIELPDDDHTRALEKSLKGLGKECAKASPYSHGALEGVELFFSSRTAATALLDPKKGRVAKLGAAGKAMADMLDLAKIVFPQLKGSTGVQILGLILKFGNMACQVHVEVEADSVASAAPLLLRSS